MALAAGTLVIIIAMARMSPRIPGSIVALALGTTAVALFKWPVETIGTRFGIPGGLPPIHLPAFRADLIGGLSMPAVISCRTSPFRPT